MQRFLASIVVVAILASSGCRLPKLYFAVNRPEPLSYDTAWAAADGGVRLASAVEPHAELVSRYRHTLAEPVSIIEWRPQVSSTWQILYATNRGRLESGEQRGPGYGNAVEDKPEFGVCAVTLPHRKRGSAVLTAEELEKRAASTTQRLLDMVTRADDPPPVPATVDIVQPLAGDAFFDKLNDLVARSPQQDVLVFVHGFNVSYEQAVVRATQMAADIPFNGAIVVYSWPSQGGVDNYKRDGEVVEDSRGPFLDFLRELGERVPREANINLVVHSMGNRLVTQTLPHLPQSFSNPPRFKEIVLCAPDVGREEFERRSWAIVDVSERATLYKNGNDAALIASRWKNMVDRAGESFNPILVEGMDTIETTIVDTSLMGHSYYGSNTSILRDLFAIVKEHRPAADREWLQEKRFPWADVSWWIIGSFPQEIDWTWHFDR